MDLEHERRLTQVEQRSKSNTHRLEKLEASTEAISRLATSMEVMASKAAKWARLRHKANAEKKIAIIFHNYPPRNSNIGSALGLDTIESVRRVLALMQERGYKVDTIPADTKEFIKQLTC